MANVLFPARKYTEDFMLMLYHLRMKSVSLKEKEKLYDMKQRINIKDLEPEAYRAMYGLEKYLSSTELNPKYRELIKIRASQINGCAYCIQLHTTDARKAGETEQRIYALSAWWESPLFSDEEKTILAMTDEISKISDKGLTEETYQEAKKIFSDHLIAQIIMQISIINTWNRIAVSTHRVHPNEQT